MGSIELTVELAEPLSDRHATALEMQRAAAPPSNGPVDVPNV